MAAMPPPSQIPLSHGSRPLFDVSDETSAHIEPREEEIVPSKSARLSPVKNAGFKPIAQASSSLKKFFQMDDDDIDPPELMSTPFISRSQESSREMQASALEASNAIKPQEDEPPRQVSPLPPRPKYSYSARADEAPSWRNDNHDNHDSRSVPISPLNPPRSSRLSVEDVERPPIAANGGADHQNRVSTLHEPVPQLASRVSTPVAPPPIDNERHDIERLPLGESRGELYVIVSQVGEGTFGKVYKARNTVTKVHVALKRIRMESERDGFPVTAMREIKLLQSLRHENVVRLYEMMVSNGEQFDIR